MDLLLLHGYNVTSTNTYGVLPQRLKKIGHNVKDVYLSKYVTLDDGLTLSDLVKGFNAALLDVYGSSLEKKDFSLITHSTGALVARAWIKAYYANRMNALPVNHLIMLAPPNNGSRLASLGKSRLSRLRSLWGVEPGVQILDALELGSAAQWLLNSDWMTEELHKASGFYPFVMTGQWIDKKLWDVIIPATYERGSDGVVRASSANLNMRKFSLVAGSKPKSVVMEGIPYLITPETSHSDERYGIVGSVPTSGDHPVLEAIIQALEVKDRKSYAALDESFRTKTASVQKQERYYDGSSLDRYCQLVFRVTDDGGNRLEDYAIELRDGKGRSDQLPSGFFGDQHKNEVNGESFVFYLDYDKLSQVKGGKLGFFIHSVAKSPLVSYAPLEFYAPLEEAVGEPSLLKPNQTTFVDVILRRRLNKEVFRLTKNLSYQKITGKPGEEWID